MATANRAEEADLAAQLQERAKPLKLRQKTLRTKMTTTTRQVETMILERGSRRGVQDMLSRAQAQLAEAEDLDGQLLELLDGREAEKQHADHLGYVRLVNSWVENVDKYLDERKDDPISVVSQTPRLRGSDISRRDAQQRQEEIAAAQQRINAAREAAAEARRRDEEARQETEAAERALRALELDGEQDSSAEEETPPVVNRVEQWVRNPKHTAALEPVREEDEAPDEWIERYLAGRDRPLELSRWHRHHHSAPLPESFSGRALDWFSWSEQFYTAVHHTPRSSAEKLALLKKNLKGPASMLVIGAGEAAYKEGLRRLKMEYGKRSVMRAAHLQELSAIELPRGDPASFKRAALSIRAHLFELTQLGEVNNADVIERLCHRMSLNDRLAWNEGCSTGLDRRTLNQFGDWFCSRAEAYQNVFGIVADQSGVTENKPNSSHRSGNFKNKNRQHNRSNQVALKTGPSKSAAPPPSTWKPYCFNCEGAHSLEDCNSFKKLTVADRTTFTVRNSLCFQCLRPKHDVSTCWRRKPCGEGGCVVNHHFLLHPSSTTSTTATARPISASGVPVALGVVSLEAFAVDGSRVPVNVMLDECSTGTLIRDGLVRRLGIRGTSQTLDVDVVGGNRTSFSQSTWVKLQLVADNGETFSIQGSTMPVVARPVPVTDWPQLQARWKHLADLPVKKSGGRVDVLLGLNHAYLMAVQESREAGEEDPIASRTRLGWVLRGVVGVDARVHAVQIHHAFTSATGDDFGPELTMALQRFCDTEEYGTEHQSECVSPDNERAIRLLDEGLLRLETGYEAPILWREGEPRLSDNRELAERRNKSLINRYRRDPDHERRYRAAMKKMFDAGYAIRVTNAELAECQPRYYLPHFGVLKGTPDLALRVVFDAAAKYRGRCLNDCIHPGPALQTSLPVVIMHFREGAVGWSSDIRAMFNRLRLRLEDQQYHHFLWVEEDETVTTCRMTRFTFGVNCSPFVVIRTTWKLAELAGPDKEEAERAIKGSVYVDDYLVSARTVKEGIHTGSLVKRVLASGDFHLQEFTSNSPELSTALHPSSGPSGDSAAEIPLGTSESEKVLGVIWHPRRDTLGFRVTGLDTIIYSRVGLISKVASLFDPLGTAAPLTVKSKIRLRELGNRGLDWNDPALGEDLDWWHHWFRLLAQLGEVEVPRCLFPKEDDIIQTELHSFADASEEAYAAVCYIRQLYRDESVVVRQVKAGSKLAPTKTLSIPKLELNAALLAARLARWTEKAVRRKIDFRFFWTDSSTVRHWIRANASYYQIFVAHRVGEIQTLTKAAEWRFCPGKLNPADAATRSVLGEVPLPPGWLEGPDFLSRPPEAWPTDLPFAAVTEELRSVRTHHTAVQEPTFDWEQIRLTVEDIPLLVKLEGDYLELVNRCQQESFQDDLDRLKRGLALKPSSGLLSWTPILGTDGLLRLGGRAEKAALPYDRLHPPMLPGSHPFVKKMLMAFHERLRHGGTDYVLTQVRHHFWILHGREAVKKVQRTCPFCIKERARPAVQLMGSLPSCRLDAGSQPFTYTACDYFGPMETSAYRNKTTKRLGALFTCLVTRGVYLDVANSLSSDDFLLILRRFMALHGKPKQLYSDNGTNFVGAERELREAVDSLHASEAATSFLQKEAIDWHFQPARTPHFGGAHEALVSITKHALYAALDGEKTTLRYPTDDILRTLLF